MATDIHMSSLSSPFHTNGAADTEHEINEYQKIIMLRNEIYAGNNPRFKPASQPGSVSRSAPQVANSPSGPSADKNRTSLPHLLPSLGASRGLLQNRAPLPDSAQMSESEISDILLAKSEVLVSAEIKLKRQRIEKELKRQLEEKRQATREEEEYLNLEEVMEKAGLSAKIIRPEEPTQEDMDMQTGEPASRRHGVQEEEEEEEEEGEEEEEEEERVLETHVVEVSRSKPPPTGPAAMSRDQEMPLRDMDTDMRSYDNARDAVAERIYSPPARPRYSATSQLRSPAAPQPVRPANMARVESQDQRIIEVDDDDDEVSYGRYPENVGGRIPCRVRASPAPYIKPEPASPGYRVPALRVHTPERGGEGGRPQTRPSQYDSGGRTRYEYPYVPPTGYYPSTALPQVPTHHPYDPHAHRESDPYAYHPPPPPAPVDYTHRSYTPAYVPPAYPPRPVYDDYDRRYPPPPAARQPSRIDRRSASPPTPYRHARHPTRSVSPTERLRREAPGLRTEYRQNRAHTPLCVDTFGRPMPPPPPPQQLPQPVYPAEYTHPYPPAHPSREGTYGGDRGYYPAPPPRAASSAAAREADLQSYRDREYYAAARTSLPPLPPLPLPIPGSGYAPPPPFDYTRAPSRAASGAPEHYSGREREWNDQRVLPDERVRESDYAGRTSVRLEERGGGYLPVRHASVRPGYGEREYAERRREGSRERYVEPPLPPQMIGFGDRERMVPPRGYEGYGGRYGGKY